MTEKSERKKPVRLEWQGGLLNSGPSVAGDAVEVKNKASNAKPLGNTKSPPATHSARSPEGPGQSGNSNATGIGGKAKVRRESKGRAGKPVAFVFEFSDPAAHSTQNLKELLSKLKTHLACGGGLEDNGLVVQVDDIPRVIAALAKFGIDAKKSGG